MRPSSPSAGEDGVVMVTVALWLPLLILFAALAIDVGNWFEHQRHLQLQADAGALAAAGDFRYPCDGAGEEAIEERAREYAGVEEGRGYNHQVGGTPAGDVRFALNSPTYPEQPSKVDPTVVAAPPCEAGMVDLKLAEAGLPLFFRVAGLFTSLPFIDAHARVQAFEKKNVAGALPVAVADTDPQRARVTFVDEETEEVLGTRELSRDGSAEGLAIWDNAAEPLPLSVEAGAIGMRVNLGGGASTNCGDPLVECYDAGSSGGIVYVRGFSTAGSGAQPGPPLARSAYLLPGSCSDPYFSAGGCSVGLHAKVDFGPCESIAEVGAELTAVVGGSSYPMTMQEPCPEGTSSSEWETSGAPIPIPAEAGPVPVSLEWAETQGEEGGNECANGAGNECKGDFGTVQRSFGAGSERSGPIRLAQVWEGGAAWADSLERCSEAQPSCTYPLVVKIGVEQNLPKNAQSAEEPPLALPVLHEAPGEPGQSRVLDCDPLLPELNEELAAGCAPEYTRNLGAACPPPSELWAGPQPWECTALQTGGDAEQVFEGMSERVFGMANPSSCVSPNEWSKFPDLYAGDPRIVPVFLTPFGSFSSSGETVPVTDFATFYVTGWAGQGSGDSSHSICPGDDPAEPGTLVGHFIKYVDALNEGGAGETDCEFNTPTPCVAVLTE